jgi:radical SAM superfamily enzyme YgiQ (UPF0313 family)
MEMRVLLVNPKYPQTFWSFNKVMSLLGKKVLLPPMGLITVAGLLPDDWDLKLVDMTIRDVSEDEWSRSDLVMVSGMTSQCAGILATVREAKRRGKTVVVGGPWAFHFPEDALKAGAAIVVKGEAETTLTALLEALAAGKSGIVIEASEKANLEHTPPPRYDLLEIENYVDMAVQFSSGCPFQCEFCDITLMFGRRVRTKTADQILAELQALYDLGWRRSVFFIDDNFIGNAPKAKALLKALVPWMEERGNPFVFYTQASVNLAADPDLLDLMARAGFYRVFLGIETPDEDSLRAAKKFQNVAADLDRVCRVITEGGLQIIAGCIIGFDGERAGADRRLIDFAVRNSIPEMFVTLLQAGPGTDLWHRLKRENRLLSSEYDENFGSQTGLINFVPTRPMREIVKEFTSLYDVLYDPEAFLERTFRHFSLMKGQPPKQNFSMPYPGEIRAVAITLIRQGVLYPSRFKFWKYMFAALWKFPARFRHFLASCITAEHYYEYRRTIQKELENRLLQSFAGEVVHDPAPQSLLNKAGL